jgi:hypothetical protein
MPRIQGRSKYLTEESSTRGPFANSPTSIFKGGHPKRHLPARSHVSMFTRKRPFFSLCCNCRLCRCVPPTESINLCNGFLYTAPKSAYWSKKIKAFNGLTRCYPPGGKGGSKLKTKQNKYLTEEAKKPYGRLQPTTSKKEKEKKNKQQKQQQPKQRNPIGNARSKHK